MVFNASERALRRSESHLMAIVSMFGGCDVDFAERHRCRDIDRMKCTSRFVCERGFIRARTEWEEVKGECFSD